MPPMAISASLDVVCIDVFNTGGYSGRVRCARHDLKAAMAAIACSIICIGPVPSIRAKPIVSGA